MEKEIKNTVLIIDKATDERFEFILPDDIEALKDYLTESDKYDVIFRETTFIHDATYREAFDLAKSHQDDNYYYKPEWMYSGDTVSESAEYFMEQLSDDISYEEDNELDENDAWGKYAQDFFWARRLSADEEQTVRKKYSI